MKKKKLNHLSDIFASKKLFSIVQNQASQLNSLQSIWEQNRINIDIAHQLQLFFKQSRPVRLDQNTLYIECTSSLIVNHARFINDDIINELKNNGLTTVSKLIMQISYDSTPSDTQTAHSQQRTLVDRTINSESIDTLEQFNASCESEVLKKSMKKLLKRIKKEK